MNVNMAYAINFMMLGQLSKSPLDSCIRFAVQVVPLLSILYLIGDRNTQPFSSKTVLNRKLNNPIAVTALCI